MSQEEEEPRVVLVVEDDPLQRLGLCEDLRSAGFEVVEAGDADEALRFLNRGSVDLLLTDVQMPGTMDGIDLAVWVFEHLPDTATAVTSGSALAHNRLKEQLPSALWLPKPIDIARDLPLIRSILKPRGRPEQETAAQG